MTSVSQHYYEKSKFSNKIKVKFTNKFFSVKRWEYVEVMKAGKKIEEVREKNRKLKETEIFTEKRCTSSRKRILTGLREPVSVSRNEAQ